MQDCNSRFSHLFALLSNYARILDRRCLALEAKVVDAQGATSNNEHCRYSCRVVGEVQGEMKCLHQLVKKITKVHANVTHSMLASKQWKT